MTDTIAQRVHQLLTESLDMPKDQRRRFLQEACANDPRLTSQCDRLLHAIDDSQSFLDRPALETIAPEFWHAEHALPERIGNYRIVRQLGSGGMGTVYEAIQSQPQRSVALKIPRRRQWNVNLQRQLQYESEILGRLRHPHIAQVFEAGVDLTDAEAPIAFFAMEFIPDARTLNSYIREQTMSVPEILALMIKVCDAVQHGHRLGIIHRDLKPANILVDTDGNPKVIDFGVASSREPRDFKPTEVPDMRQTASSFLEVNAASASERQNATPISTTLKEVSPARFGTLNYMSPEQWDGHEFLDARTDVYSLGVVLYQLLCEALPYELQGMTTAEAMQIVRTQPYREPRRAGKRLEADLQAILHKALAKDREQRYSTVDALGTDLQHVLDGFPVSARVATPWYVGRRFVRRHRWLVAASVLLLVAIMAGVVATSLFAYRTSVESQKRREAEIRALRERDDAVWQSYVANLAAGFASYGNLSQLRFHLTAAPEQHRDWEWYFLVGASESGERVVAAHDQMIQTLAVSNNGTLAATGAEDGRVRIWNTTTWEMLVDIPRPTHRSNSPVPPHSGVSAIAFRDGDQQVVAGMTDGSIRIWNTTTGELVHELEGHAQLVSSMSVHPDGTIASACLGNRCRLWDGESMSWLREINDEQQHIQGVAFCAKGQKLLTWEPNGSIWLRDLENFAGQSRFQHPGDLRQVAANSDASLIAAGGEDNRILLFSVDQVANNSALETVVPTNADSLVNPVVVSLPGNRSSTDSLSFSSDDSVIIVGRVDRRIELFSVETYASVARLRGHDDFVSGVWMKPSGDQLVSVSGDGTIRVWPLGEDRQPDNIALNTQRDERVYDFAFSPDGSRLATAGDKNIRLWQSDLLSYTEPIKGHQGAMAAVAWSRDGSVLAAGGADGIIRLTEVHSGVTREFEKQHPLSIKSLAFSLDGHYLAAADTSGSIRVWNVIPAAPEFGSNVELFDTQGQPAHQAAVNQVRFSRDGQLLASASNDRTIRIWDFEKRTLVQTLEGYHRSDVFAVVFSPDGERLYSGSRDRTIGIWSLNTGGLTDSLTNHGQVIRCLDINPAGTRLVAGSWFGDILLWDLKRLDLVTTFKAHTDIIHNVGFDPTGQKLATCSYDETIRIHKTHAKTPID